MEQTTFNIWHQSQSKKEATAGCPQPDFCMHRKIAFFAAVRGAETTKFSEKKSSVFSDSVHKTASRWQLCAVVSDQVFIPGYSMFLVTCY